MSRGGTNTKEVRRIVVLCGGFGGVDAVRERERWVGNDESGKYDRVQRRHKALP